MQKLKAGASHHSRVEFTVLSTADQVSEAAKPIEDLQRAHPATIDNNPPQIEK